MTKKKTAIGKEDGPGIVVIREDGSLASASEILEGKAGAVVEAPENPKPKTKAGRKAKAKSPVKTPRAKKATAMPKARAADNLVVFAFRLTPEERDVIHEAAGPAKASRFVRAVALAAAKRDVQALQSILLEMQKAAAG